MSNTADWYRRKLGGGGQATPVAPQRTSTPPMGPTPQAPQPYQAPYQQGQAYTEQPYQPPAEEGIAVPGEDGSWFQNLAAKGASGKHTPVKKANEVYACPECGSNNFFTRSSIKKTTEHGTFAPAPMCMECGYNGLWEQFGNQPDLTGEQQ